MLDLTNKVAFVTGGSRGIGAAIVKKLAGYGAVVAFTYVNGKEKADTVNLIQPGPIDTDMNPADSESADFQRGMMAIPKYGRPEHIADTVAFLANPDNGYTTGSVITIDGGTLS